MLSPPIRVNRRVLLCLAHPFSLHPVRLPQRRSTLLLRAPPAPSPHGSPHPPLLFHTIRRELGNLLRNRFARCRQGVLDRRVVSNGTPVRGHGHNRSRVHVHSKLGFDRSI